MTRGRLCALSAIAAAVVVVAGPWSLLSGSAGTSRGVGGAVAAGLGDGPRPAFAPGRPLPVDEAVYRWASVLRSVVARTAPGSGQPVATLSVRTPEETTNLVLVLGSTWRHAREWLDVRLPILPNNRTGWVPRSALGGYHFVTTHLVVDLERLQATLLADGRPVFRAPVGVGAPQWPTPRGEFYIRDELTDFGGAFYGPVAFGTSARSSVLTEWPDGGFVGIHGTDAPWLIPGHVSHGCIRLRNRDIVRLARLMPVGTPLTIT